MAMSVLSPPACKACITFNDGYKAAEKQAIAACQQLLAGWSQLEGASCEVTKISGGISNLLVKVSPPESSGLRPVAVKVFGEKTELLIDRELERDVLLQLNAAGFGAKVVGLFGNGRIEEFLNCKTLEPAEMADPAYVPRIASRLRAFHDLQLDLPREPSLWATISNWFGQAKELSFPTPEKEQQYKAIDFVMMESELSELRHLCERAQSPVVFSHNDLLSGNILILQGVDTHGTAEGEEGPMQFIDFEYSAYGYRGFDLGNHFNEYAGFDCDYTKYPDAVAQRLFFQHYLQPNELAEGQDTSTTTTTSITNTTETGYTSNISNISNTATSTPGTGSSLSGSSGRAEPAASWLPPVLQRLSAEANIWALASHAYWGVWALIQARYSPIQFDYLSYSAMRWAEYHRRKHEFVAQLEAAFPLATTST